MGQIKFTAGKKVDCELSSTVKLYMHANWRDVPEWNGASRYRKCFVQSGATSVASAAEGAH